jgi:hypothetical protein
MFNYSLGLVKGLYGEDKKLLSEIYFLMAIDKGDSDSSLNYANCLSNGLFGEEKQYLASEYYEKYDKQAKKHN